MEYFCVLFLDMPIPLTDGCTSPSASLISSSPSIPPILRRSTSIQPFKRLGKIMVIIKPCFSRHILNLIVGGAQKFLGAFHPAFLQVIREPYLHFLLEQIAQVRCIHAGRISRILEADGLFIISVDEFQAAADRAGDTGRDFHLFSANSSFPYRSAISRSSPILWMLP